jgi:hypothetical protein
MRFLLSAALAVALMTGLAHADDIFDGNRLYEICANPVPSEQGFCQGYAMAVAHMSNGPLIEVPSNVTARQLGDIVTRWLKAHPEQRHVPSSAAVINALQWAFPALPAKAPKATAVN